MKAEKQNQILGCMADVLNQNGYRAEVMAKEGAPDLHANQLRRACAYCNDFCALGAFGFFEQAGQIYLKHNTLLDGSLELEKNITFVADNISVLLASVSRFIDGLAQIAYAGMTLEAVIDQDLFPKIG